MTRSRNLRLPKGSPLLERLLWRVRVDETTNCWIWTGAIVHRGYGQIRVGDRRQYAHRISYELHVGPVPNGQIVCHACDNRPCINPKHLFLGTHADNVADMVAKDRQAKGGARHGRTKITASDVLAIRDKNSGLTLKELSNRYGISTRHISTLRARKSWRHLCEN